MKRTICLAVMAALLPLPAGASMAEVFRCESTEVFRTGPCM